MISSDSICLQLQHVFLRSWLNVSVRQKADDKRNKFLLCWIWKLPLVKFLIYSPTLLKNGLFSVDVKLRLFFCKNHKLHLFFCKKSQMSPNVIWWYYWFKKLIVLAKMPPAVKIQGSRIFWYFSVVFTLIQSWYYGLNRCLTYQVLNKF